MKVWLITVGEPLPTDGNGDRLLRTGILAETMAREGHEVVWWTSAFDHIRKRHRTRSNSRIKTAECYEIQMLASVGYRQNVSLRRIIDHVGIAHQWRKLVARERHPDIVLCSLPTLELCDAAVEYSQLHGIPAVIDVRDLWPDQFLDLLPKATQPLGRLALAPMFRQVKRVCRGATALCGITDQFVEWGLNHGDRARTSRDQAFAMAYRESPPTAQEIAEAQEFWKRHGLRDDQFIACFFGTIGRHFEIETVMAAVRKIEAQYPNFRAVLCGVGPSLERHQKAAAGSRALVFPGWVNAAQIWTLLRLASIGLAPYVNSQNFTRNLPNKPIEYLSAGLPVVTSLRGVLSDLLDQWDCGVVYPEGDTQALSTQLVILQRDRAALARMSRNAQTLYNQQYRASAVYAQMSRYLCDLAGLPYHRAAA